MTSEYDRYSKDELVKIIEDRDRKPKFGLVWERNDIDFDRSFNEDFVPLTLYQNSRAGRGHGAISSSKGTTSTPCATCA